MPAVSAPAPSRPDPAATGALRTIVIGAGLGGIAAAVALQRAGFPDIVILERAHDIGGVWRDNHYPGACCDVPAALYSYSFAADYPWSSDYPPQAEILQYMRQVVQRHGLERLIRFRQQVVHAAWDEAACRWQVRTADGALHEAELLVPAVGIFNDPQIPPLTGAERFEGPAFHSADWRHDIDWRGLRVAVVGTGASAVQIVPALAAQGARVTLYQRTAPYVLPRLAVEPGAASEQRRRLFETFEAVALRRADPQATAVAQAAFAGYLAQQVADPALRARLTPPFTLGCKRSAFSDTWYATLQRPDVELVTAAIVRVDAGGLHADDGRFRAADCIVYATGFRPAHYLPGITVLGRQGRSLAATWGDAARAYLGICVHGFPNCFLMFGLNTNVPGSVIFMLECQAQFVAQAARSLQMARARAIEVREEAWRDYDQRLQGELASSMQSARHCNSYTMNEHGRVVTNYPGTQSRYRAETADLVLPDFLLYA